MIFYCNYFHHFHESIFYVLKFMVVSVLAWNMDHEEVDQQIESLIQKNPEGGYLCTACGHINSSKKDLRRHVETHIDTPGYPCNFCGKQFKTRNSLNTHQSTKHREERKQYYAQ